MKGKPFKPQIYKSRGHNRSYGQGGYQTRSDNGDRGYSMNNNARQNYRGNRFRGNFRGYGRQNSRENYGNERYGNNNRDRNRSREEPIQGVTEETEVLTMIGPDQGPELV